MDLRLQRRGGLVITVACLATAFALIALSAALGTGRAAARLTGSPSQPQLSAGSSTACGEGSWEIIPSPNYTGTSNILRDIAVSAPNDAWAVGSYNTTSYVSPLIERWDGATWSLLSDTGSSGNLYGVAAISPDDAWAVGSLNSASLTMHWDGEDWTAVSTPNVSTTVELLFDVAAISSDDVWAVGRIGNDMPGAALILHWDGTSWASVQTDSPASPDNYPTTLYSVDALSADDIWAVGTREAITPVTHPLIMHYTGGQWTQIAITEDFGDLSSVEAISTNDVWVVGTDWDSSVAHTVSRTLHWDGQTWSVIPSPDPPGTYGCGLSGVSAESSDRIWAVGQCFTSTDPYSSATLVMLWDGSQWSIVDSPSVNGAQYNRLNSVAVAQPGDILAVGYSGSTGAYSTLAERYYDPSCLPPPTPIPPTNTPTPVPPAPTNTTEPTATVEPTATACAITFSDVPADHTFYPYVRCLACRGILGGYPDGTFRPGNPITRGQIAKVVSNAAGIEDDPGTQIYEDVDASNPFYTWTNRLSRRGIMSGYPCGGEGEACGAGNRPYFRPFGSTTRGQIAKIVSNAVGINDDPGPRIFEDVPPDHPFFLWVQRVTNRGIMYGYPCGGPGEPCCPSCGPWFRVYNNATRGQTAKTVARAFFPECASR